MDEGTTAAMYPVGEDAYGRPVMLQFSRRLDGGGIWAVGVVSAGVYDGVGGLTADNLREIARIAGGGVDYKKLLEWYLGNVYASDGSTYLHNAIPDHFTAEEKAELERIGDAAIEAERAHYAELPERVLMGDAVRSAVTPRTADGSMQIKIFSGERPPKCEDADPDGLLATITHYDVRLTPDTAEWVLHSGSWDIAEAGMAGFFRKYGISPDGQCDMQGSVSEVGGGGDLVLPSVVIGGRG